MPTLILGLGGTGTKVVRRLRKRWEQSEGIPRDVGMAVVDARHRMPEGGPIDDVIFTRNEPIDYIRAYDEFRDEIDKWFPKQLNPDANIDFSDGCGAIRANGRFYATHFAASIQQSLDKVIDRLVHRTVQRAGSGADKFVVYLLASLGNGTGGGTFMDIATILKHMLSYRAKVVRCFGVFIPASVTRDGNPGMLNYRVAASGYASLIELQYEFNRQLQEREEQFRPLDPYVFRAWDGKAFTNYYAGRDQDSPDLVCPLDLALIIDRRDRHGLESRYETLLHLAAEGIAQLVEGADADSRLVDALVAVPLARRFGSFGAVRLSVPARRLLDYVSIRQTERCLEEGRSHEPIFARKLLADASPDNKEVLRGEDATLHDSVDFFIQCVLQIKERGPQGGSEFNQLFDRFSATEDGLLKQFKEITEGMEDLKDAKQIVNKASEISRFVGDNTKGREDYCATRLFDGDQSLWKRVPLDPEKPTDAGVRWWIDHRVRGFVEAGAFGLLEAWLGELKRQIDQNAKSVKDHEREELVEKVAKKDVDLDSEVSRLQREADSMLSWMRKGRLRENVETFHSEGENYFHYLLAKAKVEAVERFYNHVSSHVELLENAAIKARSRLHEPRMQDPLRDRRRQTSLELDVNLKQELTSEGLKAELFIGGGDVMRERLVSDLEGRASTSTYEILTANRAENEKLFLDALGSDREKYTSASGQRLDGGDATALIDRYRNRLKKMVGTRVEPFLRERCRIDSLLEEEARGLMDEYYRCFYLEKDAMDRRDHRLILQQIEDLADAVVVEYIQKLDWQNNKQDSLDKAIDYIVAGKLYKIIEYATPQWSLSHQQKSQKELIRFTFVSYNRQAARVARGVEQMTTTLNLLGPTVRVKAQADDLLDARRIDIVQVELGGNLSALAMDKELDSYRYVMVGDPDQKGFSPHITHQYHSVGMRYLEDTGARPADAEVLLALAEVYGLVKSDAGGNYRLTGGISARQEEGRRIHKGFPKNHMVGKGLQTVVGRLQERRGAGADLREALKHTVFDRIEADAYGTGSTPPLGWEGVFKKLSERAGELRGRATQQPEPAMEDIFKKQADGLEEVAAEFIRLKGRGKPSVFG